MAVPFRWVKPTPDYIKNNKVALWDWDDPDKPFHGLVAEEWEHPYSGNDKHKYGGAFIAGDSRNPDKIYKVGDSLLVDQAIREGKLVEVKAPVEDIAPSEPEPVKEPEPPKLGKKS